MAKLAFRVAERFSPLNGETWTKYVDWSGLRQLREVVGLDAMLCCSVFGPSSPTDWDHLEYGKELGNCFDDPSYLTQRVADRFDAEQHQFLAVAREVSGSDVEAVRLTGFRFMGFELIDETSTSALTNCGGFQEAFENSELSAYGLIELAGRAYAIRETLANLYPEEHHAQCTVWAIWRRETA